MGMNVADIFAQDPELIQRRLALQEMQQLNPSGDAAGAIGAVLGRGLGNVSRGRGFFDVADPALKRVSDIQGIYNETMRGIDPSDPNSIATGLTALSKRFAEAGYTQQALMAAQEAMKFASQQRAEARAQEQLGISRENLGIDRERVKAEQDRLGISRENLEINRARAKAEQDRLNKPSEKTSTSFVTVDGKPVKERTTPEGTLKYIGPNNKELTPDQMKLKPSSQSQGGILGMLPSVPGGSVATPPSKAAAPLWEYDTKTGKIIQKEVK